MADFTWTPSRGFTTETTPRVRISRFGDGYSQRIADGINSLNQVWNLQFTNIGINTCTAIEEFLSARGGVHAFTWLPDGETTEVKVLCSKWSKTYESEFSRTLSATFERVYDL
jgi:phage-related protein